MAQILLEEKSMTYYLNIPNKFSNIYNNLVENNNGSLFKLNSEKTSFSLEVEAPGFNKNNLNLEIKETDGIEYISIEGERAGKKYKRDLIAPHNSDLTSLKASITDGILILTIPIKTNSSLKKIKLD